MQANSLHITSQNTTGRRIWTVGILLPFFATLLLDQLTKAYGKNINESIELIGFVYLRFQPNFGMMLGSMAGAPEIFRSVALSTAGAVVLFFFGAIQLLVPIKSVMFRAGLSIFVAGVVGNIIDRVRLGYVIDFIRIAFGQTSTGIFNVADSLQWVGVAMAMAALVKHGELLWPAVERRGRKWIKPPFQFRYCAMYAGAISLSCTVLGVFGYTYLKLALKNSVDSQATLSLFAFTFAFLSLGCIAAVVIVAISMSHRVAGPVLAFERFLENLLEGKSRKLKLRDQDEFEHFETIAEKFQVFFQKKLGIDPEPLKVGQQAPEIVAVTNLNEQFDLEKYRGKKVWLCIYRYATCPICIIHVHDLMARYEDYQKRGLQVVAVFESAAEQFHKSDTGMTSNLLSRVPFPMIADPEKKIYHRYRTRAGFLSLIRPSHVRGIVRALAKGYKQGSIDGELGQIPAHFLIDENGKIRVAHYGPDHLPWTTVEKFICDTNRS